MHQATGTMLRRKSGGFLLGLLGLLLLGAPAQAAPLSVRLCVDYAPVYDDASPQVGDDFLNERPARIDASGARASVYLEEEQEYYGQPTETKLVWSGELSAAGCTSTFQVSSGRSYRVLVSGVARLDGNTIEVRELEGNPLNERSAPVTFRSNGEVTVTLPDSPLSRVMGAVTYGLRKQNPGINGQTFQIWTKSASDEPCAGTSCNFRGQLYFQVDPRKDHSRVKNVLLHELGHKVMNVGSGFEQGLPKDTNAREAGRCPGGQGHRRNSVEWHAIALVEGFGHFYASAVLNEPANTCGAYSHYPVDWNHDGRPDGRIYNCDGPPVPGLGFRDGDYLGQACGELGGMANEYDYQRFFWDLYSKEGLTVRNILSILARANTPTPWIATYEPGSNANARVRLLTAARSLGFGEAWERQARFNGVDR